MTKPSVTFIAMSGVRIYNEELRALGMTLPGFIERGKVIASLPSLGVLTLAGLTPEDWKIEYLEVDECTEEVIEEIAGRSEGLIAISSLSARIRDAYKLADRLRQQNCTVVIGGLHASVLPDEAALHADSVVVGEGEPVWQQLLIDYLAGNLKSRYFSSRSREFEPWAIPSFNLLDPDHYNRITLQTTRGCPLDCSFCAASRLISPYKCKSIERVEEELDAICRIWPRPFIELADDNTFVHKAWSKQLVTALAVRNIKWFTESDIGFADDDELLRALGSSGCAQVLIGLEAIDDDALDETDTRHWKRGKRSRYMDSIQKIQDHGITVNGCFAFGFDSHGPEVFEATARFIEESRLAEVQLTVLTPFPGTALYEKYRVQNRLFEQVFWDKCTLFDVVFRPVNMSSIELENGFRQLVGEVYSDDRVGRRQTIFRECLRNARP